MLHPVASLLLLTAAAAAQTVTTCAASKDNTLYESATGALSNGQGQGAFCGLSGQPTIRRMVLAFDLAAIPTGARVLSAELHLNISRSNVFMPVPVFVHRVLADWGEGASNAAAQEGSGAPAQPGDATWLHRFYPSQTWAAAGGDFATAVSASAPTPQLGPVVIGPQPGLVADVQAFVDGTLPNHGWLLQTDEQLPTVVRRFDTRENPIVANRPTLVVTWVLPGTATVLGTGCTGSGAQPLALACTGLPLPAATVTLQLTQGQPAALAGIWLGLGMLPAPVPLYPGCGLWLDLGNVTAMTGVQVLSPNGTASQQHVVPTTPVLRSVLVTAQGFALDTGIAAGFVASNAVVLVIG